MKHQTVQEIIACLAGERTIFSYFQGRYALSLLLHAANGSYTVRTLRQSPYAQLLEKPIVRSALALCGDGKLHASAFDIWVPEAADFVLTLASWGDDHDRRYNQTSRNGSNLVLQLNFNTGDMARFARLVEYPEDYNTWAHPCRRHSDPCYRETLAWARLDVSFETDEVLIEEIQSDFVRYVQWNKRDHDDHDAVVAFCKPFRRMWHEAMLSATIQFIWQELGVTRIYYHEHTTGAALKGMKGWLPPRSLYDTLPRQFCMRPTDHAPSFLMSHRRVRKKLARLANPMFYTLEDPSHAGTTH